MILAGDIGGTKTILALYEKDGNALHLVKEEEYPSSSEESLESLLEKFLPHPSVESACFGVAGPILEGEVSVTNLPWKISEGSLKKTLQTNRVKLLNDLEATALGMLHLKEDDFETLQQGNAKGQKGTIAVIAPGTGLGEGILFWDGTKYHPIASEGGHTDFGPRNELEIDLLSFVQDRVNGRVNHEELLCGNGIQHIHDFFRKRTQTVTPDWLQSELSVGDPNAILTQVGMEGKDAICEESIELYCTLLGAEAGNLALTSLSRGGVFLGGGIPPKILAALKKPHFLEGFLEKGDLSDLMKSIPVRVALNPRAALIGAAHYLVS